MLPIYHPDRYGEFDEVFNRLANARAQEINAAIERERTDRRR